jgi:O-acetyl-ADP-ribose deacetylase
VAVIITFVNILTNNIDAQIHNKYRFRRSKQAMENSYPSRQPYSTQKTATPILAGRSSSSRPNTSLFQNYPQYNTVYPCKPCGGQTFQAPKVRAPKTPHQRVLNGVTYEIRQGSITDYEGQAIVNAANEQGLGGGGVDGAISAAGGYELSQARRELPTIWSNVRVRTGDARATVAGNLRVDYVIHAVGPNLSHPKATLDELKAAYTSAIAEAYMLDVKDLAFPIISGGVFSGSYPLHVLIKTAFEGLIGREQCVKKIVFYGFKATEVLTLVTQLDKVIAAPYHIG